MISDPAVARKDEEWAWQLQAEKTALTLVDIGTPDPGPGEIAVEPQVVGLCHTDVSYMDGTLTSALGRLPITLGHEIAGVVSAVGHDVSSFEVGQRVAIRSGYDTPGTRMDGGFATTVVTPAEFVARIPDDVSFEHAAVATDGGLTSYHAVKVVGEVSPGDKVGVIGLGGLGFFGAQVAAALGAQVYAVDPNPAAREAMKRFEFAEYVADISELAGKDLDVVVDFAGFGTTTSGAMDAVRSQGTIVQVGVSRPEATIDIPALVIKEIKLQGSLAGTVDDLIAVMDMIAKGELIPLISTIPFDQVPEGYERLERGEVRGRLVAEIGR